MVKTQQMLSFLRSSCAGWPSAPRTCAS
jgi:hypothetical protein